MLTTNNKIIGDFRLFIDAKVSGCQQQIMKLSVIFGSLSVRFVSCVYSAEYIVGVCAEGRERSVIFLLVSLSLSS